MPKSQFKSSSNENNAFARRSLEPVVTGLGRSFCSSSVAEARDKHYFSLPDRLISMLRRFLLIRPHGIKRRSFMNSTKALGFEIYIKRLSFINRAGFVSSATLFIISLLIIFPIYHKTNLAEAAGSLSDTTLSITSDNLVAGVDLLVTSDSGTFATSNPISFTVTTTNSSGYTLSLKSKNGSTDLTNIVSSDNGTDETIGIFSTIANTSGISADTFSNSDNTAYNNHWGIKPSYYGSVANSDGLYYPSPDSTGIVLNATDSANVSGSADAYTIAIGARATYAQPAGTYSNNYILSAVGNYPRQATCTKQYRLQNADGTFPTEYTLDTTEELDIGTTCTYTKSVSDYKYGGASATNGASGTISSDVTEDGTTLSLDFYRNTYALTVSAGSNTSSATGSGTYRWGQTVTVGVTKATNTTCLTYATPTWTQSGTTGTFSSTSGTSVNFTMGKGTSTVTATSSSSRNTYTITYNKNGGTGTMSSTTGSCGEATTLRANTFTRSGYNFLGWSTSNTATSATYTDGQSITLSQTGTLALYAVWQQAVYMHSFSLSDCQSKANGTNFMVTDYRDKKTYTVKYINGECWMTQNLRFTGESVNSTYTNINTSKTLTYYDLATNGTSKDDYCYGGLNSNGLNNACIKDSGDTSTGVWYNFAAASAMTLTGSNSIVESSYDVCPKNWHIPTGPNEISGTDFNKLVGNETDDWQDPTDGLKAFDAVTGGYYYRGTLRVTDRAYWWSSSPGTVSSRCALLNIGNLGQFDGSSSADRSYGAFIRCVRSS